MVGDVFVGAAAADTWIGTEGEDIASGGGGNDTLVALGGNDILSGDAGADTIIAGAGHDVISGGIGNDQLTGDAGNDTFNYTFGDGVDGVNGGADLDTLNILGAVANDTLNVTFNGTALTSFDRWNDHGRRIGHRQSAGWGRYADLQRNDGSRHGQPGGRDRIGVRLDRRHRERHRRDRRQHADRG